jgi:DegV family protein with EDD domain
MIRVVTDSTSDLPADVVEDLGITVIPLLVLFGDDVYRDGIDLSSEEFFRRLALSHALPTTSQPSVGVFREAYRQLSAETSEIVSIHISARLSGTCASAVEAARSLGGSSHIEVVDSQSTSMGLGFQVMAAARAAQAGAGLEEAVAAAHSVRRRHQWLALFETLEYLRRGGRIGRAQAFLGSVLNIKPLLTLRDGEAHPIGRVRTRPRALQEICRRALAHEAIEQMAIMHATSPGDAEMLAQTVRGQLPGVPVYVGRLGPVVGVHSGPGAIGMVVVQAERG